ncbi:tyrosine-protein phosphatase non-receptor type 21 [Parasteatoda tepidariorum]|uniref:tyrosine-protein phosphatase non-receptor type 21 n=1 Tax=Parasteatoda tepidariorum TaxID=114398 RepID=UPI0039BD1D20
MCPMPEPIRSKMPFKLKLKKSRQYNVSSKNLFVLSVELLDNTTVECTLSAQSLGQECLNNVCQRLGLQQPQFFGLKFLSKKGSFWWVDLKRPLKRQLDKYALESCSLYLGVMFFVADVNILHDEVTRYHYFLQLKSDILEGKLRCNEDQMILFASYSLQAEFGDHDPERHTTEYLSNFGLLPKQIAGNKENAILERVILSHRSLQGMPQQLAEVYYIMEAQHLNGYGLECFAAKDHADNSIIIGVLFIGIYIWYLNNQPSIYFSWEQIINLVHHKRCFSIEHRNASKVLQIYLDDSHFAKYVWRTCIQQHGFYSRNEGVLNSPVPEQLVELKPPNIYNRPAENKPQSAIQDSHESLDGLGVYHTDQPFNENVQTMSNQQPDNTSCKVLSSHPPPISARNSNSCISSTNGDSAHSIYSQSALRRASSSDASIHRSLASIQETDTKPVSSVLPLYRQAPDYDTAVKLKYGLQSYSTGDMSASHLYQSSPTSNPVESVHPAQQQQSYSQYKNYVDLSLLNMCDGEKVDPKMLFRSSRDPPVHTYSSPDLAVPHENTSNPLHHFKPPPPYPYMQRSSCSTPDLTRNSVVSTNPSAVLNKPNLPYKIVSVGCAKVVTSNPIQQQTVASTKLVDSQNNLPTHSYENCKASEAEGPTRLAIRRDSNRPSSLKMEGGEEADPLMGPMLVAAMNGLCLSRPNFLAPTLSTLRIPNDTRIQALESRLSEGQVFLEFERIPKKKPNADFTTALLPENVLRNRFKDVFPYEENRVRLTPTSENKTGYINASYLNVSIGSMQRFYIAAQGPLPNTLYSFWQMVWEDHVMVIVMLTDVQEEGREKCFPYWPQEDGNKLQIGEFQITRNFSMSSSTYTTCSLSLSHVISHQQRPLWHIQYTDWPDHSCPHDLPGFISFMGEMDAVRRHAAADSRQPVLVHCSAGVGRSGAVLLCDIMLHCLDHNQAVDVPKVLTHLRFQRMLTVQTLAQYKFVYTVLIQYLKNSRLI